MEQSIDLWQLLSACGLTLSGIVGAWINMKTNVSSLKQDIEYVKKELQEEKDGNKKNYAVLNEKLDQLLAEITALKVALAKQTGAYERNDRANQRN